MKDYVELSDDALIDLLVAKTKSARAVQLGLQSGEYRVVSRTGRKQDGHVSTAAKFADPALMPITSRRVHRPDSQQDFQGDFLATVDLDSRPEPGLPLNDVPSNAGADLTTHGPTQCLNKEIGSANELDSFALPLIQDEHQRPDGVCPPRDTLREQLLAGGAPLGECDSLFKGATVQSSQHRISNTLFYGDNLGILREEIESESIDLIYLDPPFNSQASYNVLFKTPSGEQSKAQIEAFEDTWYWNTAEKAFDDVMAFGNSDVAELLHAMRSFLKENDMMAYLTMMAIRLLELHRVLKSTGTLYLHCDSTASHYLKLLLDAIFGAANYRNEIIWRRSNPKSHISTNFPSCTDTILRYSKGPTVTYHQPYEAHDLKYIESAYKYADKKGVYRLLPLLNPNDNRPNLTYEFLGVRRVWRWTRERMEQAYRDGLVVQLKPGAVPQYKKYLEDSKGKTITNCWTDVPQAAGKEVLGYPTQKPLALLERIISASSNEGDLILDPFCGCGTTIHASQKLRRNWIGIDITHLAISLIEKRLRDAFPDIKYSVHGTPKDTEGARALADRDKYQFQWWAVSLVNAVPYSGRKRGADSGIDGIIYFKPDARLTEKGIVSVKGGQHVSVAMIRDLAHVVDREKAKLGVFIALAKPTVAMRTEAVKAGFYESPYHGKVQKIQILTIEELLSGTKPRIPFVDMTIFPRTLREESNIQQGKLL